MMKRWKMIVACRMVGRKHLQEIKERRNALAPVTATHGEAFRAVNADMTLVRTGT